MKKLAALVLLMSLSPLHIAHADDKKVEPQVLSQREFTKQILGQNRRLQAQTDREVYRENQPNPEARRELAQEMRQLQESKRAPASK